MSPAERYKQLNSKQLMAYIGTTRRNTVWDYVRRGILPQPRYIQPHRPVWRLGEVVDALERLPGPEAKRGYRGHVKALRSDAALKPKAASTLERMRERFGLKR
jgi:predicted DNA-binding transcriptional regulator AlpA